MCRPAGGAAEVAKFVETFSQNHGRERACEPLDLAARFVDYEVYEQIVSTPGGIISAKRDRVAEISNWSGAPNLLTALRGRRRPGLGQPIATAGNVQKVEPPSAGFTCLLEWAFARRICFVEVEMNCPQLVGSRHRAFSWLTMAKRMSRTAIRATSMQGLDT